MKYMTKKNIEKVTNIIMKKGYDKNTAENMAQHLNLNISIDKMCILMQKNIIQFLICISFFRKKNRFMQHTNSHRNFYL